MGWMAWSCRPSSSERLSVSSWPAVVTSAARNAGRVAPATSWPRRASRSRSQASWWSRASSKASSIADSRWRCGVVGDSSTTSRVFCRWSANTDCCSSMLASSAGWSASNANRWAWVRRICAKLCRHSASIWVRKRLLSAWVVNTPHSRYNTAPRKNQPPWRAICSSEVAGGAAIENSIENNSENVSGPPRLPQDIIITARKVPVTSTVPSSQASWSVSCTSMNRGVPSSGAGSICMILRLRADGTSGRLVTITPTAALDAPARPAVSKISSMITTRPTVTLRPLVTYWLSATRSRRSWWACRRVSQRFRREEGVGEDMAEV